VPELLIRRCDQWHGYRAAKALAELNWQPLGCKAVCANAEADVSARAYIFASESADSFRLVAVLIHVHQ
jgi:hypothetical protein